MRLTLFKPLPAGLLCMVLGLGACTSSAPLSRVILLPDAAGGRTSVVVSTPQGSQVLDAPYSVAQVNSQLEVVASQTTPEAVAKTYPSLLQDVAGAPQRFVLLFEPGSAALTNESLSILPSVIEAARQRPGGEIVITGHTDRQGSLEANDRLSLQRAQAIRALMLEQGFLAELIEARGRGEREPVVPTDDEVAEPRNRRVDVLVR